MTLSPQQEQLLSIAREKGFLRIQDAHAVYSGSRRARMALRRLDVLGFIALDPDVPNRFVYTGDSE